MQLQSTCTNSVRYASHSKAIMHSLRVADSLSVVTLQHIDGINLFGLISIASLLYCTPAAILMEGSKWSGAYSTALQSVGRNEFFKQMAAAGIFYHLYNQVGFLHSIILHSRLG